MDGPNLTLRDLDRSDRSGASLRATNLSDTRIKRTNFTGANMEGVILTKAVLRVTDLSGANLSVAVGLKAEQLDKACGNSATILPEGLTIRPCN